MTVALCANTVWTEGVRGQRIVTVMWRKAGARRSEVVPLGEKSCGVKGGEAEAEVQKGGK